MNVVREITRINQAELDIALKNPSASWHAQYSDSAYIFIGGLPYDLTEGDVITIFSQYGEVVDVNLPRAHNNPPQDSRQDNKNGSQQQQQKPVGKGKHRGFGFLMYEDQRSTVLAVDNLNGAQVLGRTLRVDHVASYKQPKMRDEDGELVDAREKSLNAVPVLDSAGGEEEEGEEEGDLEDPMASYFKNRREEKGKSRQNDDWEREEKRKRKEERARIRAERELRKRERGSSSKRYNDQRREEKRHRSSRRKDEDSEDEKGQGVNRYEQIKKQRSILDGGDADRRRESRHRSRTPPSRSRSDRDPDYHRRRKEDDRDRKHRRHSNNSSSSGGRRRSRSPA